MKGSSERILSVKGLSVTSRIGVPDLERSAPQALLLDLRFAGVREPSDLKDDIASTVDYHAVAVRASEIAGTGERRLIETLAQDLAAALMVEFVLRWIEVRVRKFILPDAEWVSVEICRSSESQEPLP